ncbi:Transforming growth factor-beta C-terminal [Trinorchestia longiramus]|nr:Transforming growth factor-beta C-terminal [Trinorchestia longiramus]
MLDLPGPGGRRVDPPQVMLELYSQVSQSSPAAQLPHGATTVTAVPASVETEHEFQFVLPALHHEEEVAGVEFHMHHGHLKHFYAYNHRGLSVQIEASIYGTESSSSQILSDPTTGWYKFPLGAADVIQLHNRDTTRQKFPLTIHTKFITNNGEIVNLTHHHKKSTPNQASLLIIFSRKRNTSLDTRHPHTQHHENQKELVNTHRAKRSLFSDISQSSNSSRSSATPNECNRRSLTINFSHIGWSSWILAPASFDAFYCSGSCGFPIGQDMNPTNHAVVQSVARLLINEDLPTPHCVPSAYSSLSILYVDSFDNVVLKSYEEMIADSCGCH